MTKTINWAAAVDGNFGDGPNWVGGMEPNKTQDANLLSFGGSPYAVTFDTSPGGQHGKKPTTIWGLQVGSGVTVDILQTLDVGAYKLSHGGLRGGEVANSGIISISELGNLRVYAQFVNFGTINITNGEIFLSSAESSIVNSGLIVLSDGGIAASQLDGGVHNSGTISGLGKIIESITNYGLIQSNSTDHSSTGIDLDGSVVNNGLLEAVDGSTLEVDGPISGTGSVKIDGGRFAAFQYGGGTLNQDVNFGVNSSSVLVLGAAFDDDKGPEIYTGTISGFSKIGDSTIDLGYMVGSGPAQASYSGTKKGGVLTITGDGQTRTFAFSGNYLGITFSANMTANGTVVTAQSGGAGVFGATSQAPSIAHFAGAMAGLTGHGAADWTINARTVNDGRQMLLATPRLALA